MGENTYYVTLLGPKPRVTNFQWEEITSNGTEKVVSKFSNCRTMDFNCLSNYIIKQSAQFISIPLAYIFHRCLKEGYFQLS